MITEKGSITASSADNNDMTVSQLFEVWLKSGGETSRKNTPRNYFFYYVTYLAEPFGSRRVNDISYEEWRAFKKKLSTVRDTWTDEVTAAISKRILFSFSKAFAYGHAELGLNDPNVKSKCTGSSKPRRKASAGNQAKITLRRPAISSRTLAFSSQITDVFSDEEVERMKASLIGYNNTHICVMLCLFAGIGQSEICALRWKDIDTGNGTVAISRTYLRRFTPKEDSVTALKESVPKGQNGIRIVPIPQWLSGMLAPLKPFYKDDDHVLTGNSEPVGPATFCYNYLPRFLDWAGVEQRPFPALRNTFVRMCFENGTDVGSISRLLGCTEKKTMSRYFSETDNDNDEQDDLRGVI